jgi:hypothetical protein
MQKAKPTLGLEGPKRRGACFLRAARRGCRNHQRLRPYINNHMILRPTLRVVGRRPKASRCHELVINTGRMWTSQWKTDTGPTAHVPTKPPETQTDAWRCAVVDVRAAHQRQRERVLRPTRVHQPSIPGHLRVADVKLNSLGAAIECGPNTVWRRQRIAGASA